MRFTRLLLPLLVFPVSGNAEGLRFFIHWQNSEGNAELLERGHGQSQIGADGLEHGTPAHLEPGVFAKIRDWYQGAKQADAGGAGLYMADTLLDTRDYGEDLLIVEFDGTMPNIHLPKSNEEFKRASNAMIAAGREGELPLITQYYGKQKGWYVVPRPLSSEEARHLRVNFRRPTPGDVGRYWDSLKTPEEKFALLTGLVNEVTGQGKKGLTEPARAFLHRLFFDRGPGLFTPEFVRQLVRNAQPDTAGDLSRIAQVFRATHPDDPRTRELHTNIVRGLRKSGAYFDRKYLGLLTDSTSYLPAADLTATADWMLTQVKPGEFQRTLGNFLLVTDLVEHASPSLSEPAAQWKELFARTLSEETERPWSITDQRVLDSLRKKVGPPRLVELLRKDLLFSLDHFDQDHKLREVERYSMEDLRARFRFFFEMNENDPEFADRLIEILRHAAEGPSAERTLINLFPALMERFAACKNGTICQAFIRAIEKSISVMNKKEHPTFARIAGFWMRDALVDSGKVESLTNTLELLVRAIPNHPEETLKALGAAEKYFSSTKVVFPVPWASIRAGLKARLGDLLAGTPSADETTLIVNGYNRAGMRIDEAAFRARVKQAVLPISGSLPYSELVRTFALVDPLYVSEDLRRMQANQPFRRFNESHISVHGTISQPAWENFNEAWEMMAARLELFQRPIMRDGPFSIPMIDVQETLMKTAVDGVAVTQNSKLREAWDRKKYTTLVPEEDWSHFSAGEFERELRRYFVVNHTNEGYELRFRTDDELTKSMPGRWRPQYSSDIAKRIEWVILRESVKLKDPIQQAARILYLYPRLHPYENGNGRKGRLMASVLLARNGLPVPVGLPTHDFMLSQRMMELHLRKALRLGRFWQDMLERTHATGVPSAEFFQKVYRGSDLEGLVLASPQGEKELAQYVDWLHSIDRPPAWARDYGLKVEEALAGVYQTGRSLPTMTENARTRMLEDAWLKFRTESAARLPRLLAPGFGNCERGYLRLVQRLGAGSTTK